MSTFGGGAEIGGRALPSPRSNGVRLGGMSFARQARPGWRDEQRRSRRTPKDVNAARSPANSHVPGWTGVHFRTDVGAEIGWESLARGWLSFEDARGFGPRGRPLAEIPTVGMRRPGGLADLVFWFFCG